MNIIDFAKGLADLAVPAETIYKLVSAVRKTPDFEEGSIYFSDPLLGYPEKIIPDNLLRLRELPMPTPSDLENLPPIPDELKQKINKFVEHIKLTKS